ncbi:MAG: radical SAM protein [Planctomycetes bacterium]|nr:radical SAM protein [Planctomycetota bacterium]
MTRQFIIAAETREDYAKSGYDVSQFEEFFADSDVGLATVYIPVHRYNFTMLRKLLSSVAAKVFGERRHLFDSLDEFAVEPLDSIHTRFRKHLSEMETATRKTGGAVQIVKDADPDLLKTLAHIEKNHVRGHESGTLRALGYFSARAFVGPKHLLIDPLKICDLNCIYCKNFSPISDMKREDSPRLRDVFPLADYKRMIDDAAEMRVEQIDVCGGGEPSLHPDLLEMGRYAVEKGMWFNISTNGLSLTKEKIEALVEAGVTTITFSVSAASEETYEITHPGYGKRYWKVLDNIRHARLRRMELKKDVPQLLYLVAVTKPVVPEFLDCIREAARVGADRVWYQFLHVHDFNASFKPDASEMQQLLDLMPEAHQLADDLGVTIDPYFENQLIWSIDPSKWSYGILNTGGCPVGYFFSAISHERVLGFCCGAMAVGNVREKRLKDEWFGEHYNGYRYAAQVYKGYEDIQDDLNTPFFREWCNHCDNHNFVKEMNELIVTYLPPGVQPLNPALADEAIFAATP